MPPSMQMSSPVMKPALSEHKNSTIWAMSCGVPVVATRIPGSGVPVVNADGVSGLNAEPGSPESLASALMEIISGQEDWKAWSERALDRYRTFFTLEKMVSGCIGIYEKKPL